MGWFSVGLSGSWSHAANVCASAHRESLSPDRLEAALYCKLFPQTVGCLAAFRCQLLESGVFSYFNRRKPIGRGIKMFKVYIH